MTRGFTAGVDAGSECVKAVETGKVDLNLLVTNKDYDLASMVQAIEDLEAGKEEAVFALVPCALGLDDNQQIRDEMRDKVMDRIQRLTGESVRDDLVFSAA